MVCGPPDLGTIVGPCHGSLPQNIELYIKAYNGLLTLQGKPNWYACIGTTIHTCAIQINSLRILEASVHTTTNNNNKMHIWDITVLLE